jgi:hypothetical protein
VFKFALNSFENGFQGVAQLGNFLSFSLRSFHEIQRPESKKGHLFWSETDDVLKRKKVQFLNLNRPKRINLN